MKVLLIIMAIVVVLFILAWWYYDQLKILLLNVLIIKRGILAVDCNWYSMSDIFLTDSSGINLYKKYKSKYGDFAPATMFGEKVYIVTNINHIKTILDGSPNLFGPGRLKQQFFNSFMENNVGVSKGCPWARRRAENEQVLFTDSMHIYADKYNNDTHQLLLGWGNAQTIGFDQLSKFGKAMVARIVFGKKDINEKLFSIFSEANSIQAFYNPDFQINPDIFDNYQYILNENMATPQAGSLIDLYMQISDNKQDILHQIPHFIFPIAGLYITTIPRTLILLYNSPQFLRKVLYEITVARNINDLSFTRKCILETLRLNNPVITTFRTLEQEYTFDNGQQFPAGTQFLILNNPVLREEAVFANPNVFNPDRWTVALENEYYAISFSQGPQRCPGKDLALFLAQAFIYNFLSMYQITDANKIDTNNVPQIINPCKIKILKI